MNRYLIEIPHDPTHVECGRLAEPLTRAGAHYVARAAWGCDAGVHKSWLITEALNDEDAELIAPPAWRCRASVVRLNELGIHDLHSSEEGGGDSPSQEAVSVAAPQHSHWPKLKGSYFNPDGAEMAMTMSRGEDSDGESAWDRRSGMEANEADRREPVQAA